VVSDNVHLIFQDTVFDPVALGCGHVFCNSCVCAAASVLAYEGPRSADINAKCPLCRKVRRYLMKPGAFAS
jgi:E3 ubiquitin-protein ligase BAH